MIALVLVALAVPLTLVALGIRQFSSKSRPVVSEAPELRRALEQAAEKNWRPPEILSDGRSVFVLSTSTNHPLETVQALRTTARKLDGTVLPASAVPGGDERLLVQIPDAGTNVFESQLRRDFVEKQSGHSVNGSRLYEIIVARP